MGYRNSQINLVLAALDYLNLETKDVIKITYKELEEKLVDYEIPNATWIELWAEGSVPKPKIKNIIHSKPVSKQRFLAMIKQAYYLEELGI